MGAVELLLVAQGTHRPYAAVRDNGPTRASESGGEQKPGGRKSAVAERGGESQQLKALHKSKRADSCATSSRRALIRRADMCDENAKRPERKFCGKGQRNAEQEGGTPGTLATKLRREECPKTK